MIIDFEIKCPKCGFIGISQGPSKELENALYCTCYRCKIDFWIRRRR